MGIIIKCFGIFTRAKQKGRKTKQRRNRKGDPWLSAQLFPPSPPDGPARPPALSSSSSCSVASRERAATATPRHQPAWLPLALFWTPRRCPDPPLPFPSTHGSPLTLARRIFAPTENPPEHAGAPARPSSSSSFSKVSTRLAVLVFATVPKIGSRYPLEQANRTVFPASGRRAPSSIPSSTSHLRPCRQLHCVPGEP